MLLDNASTAGVSAQAELGQVSVKAGGLPLSDALDEATSIRMRLRDAGYTPVPAEGKACHLKRWPALAGKQMSEQAIEGWKRTAKWKNTGIVCDLERVIDLDIDDPKYAESAKQIVIAELGDKIPLRVGKAPRMSFFLLGKTPGKSEKFDGVHGSFEILRSRSHVIVHGDHPDTGRPYQWLFEPLWEIAKDRLPKITPTQEARIVDKLKKLLVPRVRPTKVWAAGGRGRRKVQYGARIPMGRRNNETTLIFKEAALRCGSFNELLDYARNYSTANLDPPFSEEELLSKIKYWWDRKAEGQLFPKGGEPHAVLKKSEFLLIKNPDAVYLLMCLRLNHGAEKKKRFAIAAASALQERLNLKEKPIRKATRLLMKLDLINRVGGAGKKGSPFQYLLT